MSGNLAGARSTRAGRIVKPARPVSAIVGDRQKTNAPEALTLAGEEATGAPEVDMVQRAVARGKATGNGARARQRAEKAVAEGRSPGGSGWPKGRMRKGLPPTGPYAPIGTAVRVARQAAHLTQPALAERLGVPPSYVARVEAGGVGTSPAWLRRFADACGMAPEAVGALVLLAERVSFEARVRTLLAEDDRHREWIVAVVAGSGA